MGRWLALACTFLFVGGLFWLVRRMARKTSGTSINPGSYGPSMYTPRPSGKRKS